MTEHFKINEYIGARVLNQAKETKLWALASALDTVTYNLIETTNPKVAEYASETQPRLVINAREFLGTEVGWDRYQWPWLTKNETAKSYYAHVPRLLREIVGELERLAILEVTK